MSEPTPAVRWPEYTCCRCQAPIPPGEHVILTSDPYGDRGEPAHRRCARADADEITQIRAEACQQGHHRYPGAWSRDPVDPFGDAMLWACARGCGYVRRHPGYGINRSAAAAQGALFPAVGRG